MLKHFNKKFKGVYIQIFSLMTRAQTFINLRIYFDRLYSYDIMPSTHIICRTTI